MIYFNLEIYLYVNFNISLKRYLILHKYRKLSKKNNLISLLKKFNTAKITIITRQISSSFYLLIVVKVYQVY